MEYERPFTCTYTGCGMTFDTQESLMSHKRHHLIPLNFENASRANTSVDQTPTPTRFIRNCEEVGLFQDLQNVNPFEETFRRANEAGNAGQFMEIDSDVLSGTDDTLHTPPFYPNITGQICAPRSTQVVNSVHALIRPVTEVQTNEDINKKKPECYDDTTPVSQLDKETRSKINIQYKRKSTAKVVTGEASNARGRSQLKTSVPYYRSLNTRPIAPHPSTQPSGTVSLQTAAPEYNQQNSSANTKQVLRKTLLNQKRAKPPSNESASLRKISKTTLEPPQTLEVNRQTPEDQQRIRQFRERNRVAASRCREKRKKWVEELETQVKLLRSSSVSREAEVARLRMEVEKYKAILLKHSDCSVTRAENQGVTQVLAEPPSKVYNTVSPTLSSVPNPIPEVRVLDENQSDASTKASKHTVIRVALPHISETSVVQFRPVNSIAKLDLSPSSFLNTGTHSGELNTISTACNPLLGSVGTCENTPSNPPPGIPIISNVCSFSFANEEEDVMKSAHVLKVPNSGKCYLLNIPSDRNPNITSGVLKPGFARINFNEPGSNNVQIRKDGLFILYKEKDVVRETAAQLSTQTSLVPEVNIPDHTENPPPLQESVTTVEAVPMVPDDSREIIDDKEEDVIFIEEVPATRVPRVLAKPPSKVYDTASPTLSSVPNPVPEVDENQSGASTKRTKHNVMKMALPRIAEEANKTSTVEFHPVNSVAKFDLSRSDFRNMRTHSGELNAISTACDPLLGSVGACENTPSSPPTGIPIISNVCSIAIANKEEDLMKSAHVLNVPNSRKCYLLNIPIDGNQNIASGLLKPGFAQLNFNESGCNNAQTPKDGLYVIYKEKKYVVRETAAQLSTETSLVPEIIPYNEEIPLPLQESVPPVETGAMCLDDSCEIIDDEEDDEEDVIFIKEIFILWINTDGHHMDQVISSPKAPPEIKHLHCRDKTEPSRFARTD